MITSVRIIGRAFQQWGANKDSRLGAALAYYTLFSIAPLLVIAIRIAGLIFGEDAARGEVVNQLTDAVGKEPAVAIQNLVEEAAKSRTGTVAPVISLGLLVIGALGVFLHVRGALCTIWKLEPPHGSTILGILLDYALALAMVVITGVLLLLSLAASMAIPVLRELVNTNFQAVHDWLKEHWPWLADRIGENFLNDSFYWQFVEFGVSLLFLMLLFATIYRILSGQRIPWRYVWYGSLISAFLFSLGKIALGLYLVHTGTASMYGAAGSVVVFLIWVYYSSQILFFGAELIQARRTRKEWMKPTPTPAG